MIAIELFREGLVSIGKASGIAGIARNEMMDLLGGEKFLYIMPLCRGRPGRGCQNHTKNWTMMIWLKFQMLDQ